MALDPERILGNSGAYLAEAIRVFVVLTKIKFLRIVFPYFCLHTANSESRMPVHGTPQSQSQRFVHSHKPLLRRFAGVMAVLSLMLQLLAPSLASATQGDWIEICSEYGTILKQVDLSDETRSPGKGHSDCEDCTFCALAALTSPPTGPEFDLADASNGKTVRWVELLQGGVPRHLWPETRGPPALTQTHKAVRDIRALMALTNFQGGAL